MFVRIGGRWQTTSINWEGGPLANEDQIGEFVPADIVPGAARALMVDDETGRIKSVRLAQVAKYFPAVGVADREGFQYPEPLSAEFWRHYGEPILEFIAAVDALRSVAPLALRRGRRRSRSVTDMAVAVDGHVDTLAHLTSAASMTLAVGANGALRQRWVSSSLIATLALMIAQDGDGGWRLIRCPKCKSSFVTLDPRQRYCSNKCRWAVQKRNQRSRMRRRLRTR
jgi:hypothetical protein